MASLMQLFSNLLNKLLHKINCFKEAIFILELAKKNAQKAIFSLKYTDFVLKRHSHLSQFFYKLIPNLLGHPLPSHVKTRYISGTVKRTYCSTNEKVLLPTNNEWLQWSATNWPINGLATWSLCPGGTTYGSMKALPATWNTKALPITTKTGIWNLNS